MLEGKDILFMGLGQSAVLWYRVALPALALGADWVGVRGQPPGLAVLTGLVRGDTKLPTYEDYQVVVIQQPAGRPWLKLINSLRERGIKVLYEIDDYLHGVAQQPQHSFAKDFTKQRLAQYELCMRACDGIICSTPYLARRYARFNRVVYVCRNGIDVQRYALTRPERSTVTVLWAGATGHSSAILPWVNGLLPLMREHGQLRFVSIGEDQFAPAINEILGEERAIGIPFIPIDSYPSAMTLGDIAIAPAGMTTWYRGKSDLRFLEAGALGIPIIADPRVYCDIEPGVTGFWAESPVEMVSIVRELLADPELRARVGNAAREYVHAERTSEIAARQWFEVCAAAVGEYESVSQLRRA